MKQDFEYVGKSYYSKVLEAYLHVIGVCSDNYEHTEKEKKVRVLYVGKERNVIQEYYAFIAFLSKVSYCREISNGKFAKVYDKVLHFFEDKRMRMENIKVKPLKLEDEK